MPTQSLLAVHCASFRFAMQNCVELNACSCLNLVASCLVCDHATIWQAARSYSSRRLTLKIVKIQKCGHVNSNVVKSEAQHSDRQQADDGAGRMVESGALSHVAANRSHVLKECTQGTITSSLHFIYASTTLKASEESARIGK